jgi:DNA-binding transcriptional LysR family regulator
MNSKCPTVQTQTGNSFDFRHAQAFLIVAQSGSIAAAASRMHLSPSSLSRIISELEHELEEKLFERLPQGVRLSAAGTVFMPYATRLAETYTNALQDLKSHASPKMVLACISILLPSLLPLLHTKPASVQGDEELVIDGMASHQVIDAVVSGAADFGLCMLVGQYEGVKWKEPVFSSSLGLLAGKSMQLPKEFRSLDELEGLPFVRLHDDLVFSRMLREHGITLPAYSNARIVNHCMPGLIASMASGNYVTIVSAVVASSALAAGLNFIPLSNLLPDLQLSFIWHDSVNSQTHENWRRRIRESVLAQQRDFLN